MSKLTALRDKEPKEVARLLSLVSNSLLPNAGIREDVLNPHEDSEVVKAVLSEIRERLQFRKNDHSREALSRIYMFLSEELSRVALSNVDLRRLKERVGNKGYLHPSQYQVRFVEHFDMFEKAFGTRRSHIVEAVSQPTNVTHLRAKYVSEGSDPNVTISVKYVSPKSSEDRFFLLVISDRNGSTLRVGGAFRLYLSDVNISEAAGPVEMARAFADTYGQPFRLGGTVYKFLQNEYVTIDTAIRPRSLQMKPIGLPEGSFYLPILFGGGSKLRGAEADEVGEAIFGFVVNVAAYVATLRKHGVHLSPESDWLFPRVGQLP